MKINFIRATLATLIGCSYLSGCSQQEANPLWSETVLTGDIMQVSLENRPTLAYSKTSGVKLLTIDRLPFKDLNRDGKLQPYEDWRLDTSTRATNLASLLSEEEIAGLMLYSRHQSIPAAPAGYFADTYGGKPFPEAGVSSDTLSDGQLKFIQQDHLRHVLLTSVESPAVAARWNNKLQSLAESIGFGIPANNSSDPRHGARAEAEYNAGSGGTISQWPENLGLAATFDPAITEEFGRIASIEYRALGITTALSPQIDLATEPRWNRFFGTFGGHPALATDMARAYIDGFQYSPADQEIANGWGTQSVNAMVKHWPSGGPEEAGRDGHFAYGKFAVYPGGHFDTHMKPFLEGAFKLKGKTGKASAVMPYYTISVDQDTKYGENVGNGYSKYIVTDLLREKYGYDGVVCTDWGITWQEGASVADFAGKSWGVETLSIAERHLKVLEAGLDQFGGNNDAKPVLEAFHLMKAKYGEEATRARIERSAVRLLKNIFNVGLFENPYLNPEVSSKSIGTPEYMESGYNAQLKSIVMVKNNDALPLKEDKKVVYVPKITVPEHLNFFGYPEPEKEVYPIERSLLEKDFSVTDNIDEADLVLAFIKSPVSDPYSKQDRANGGNGYLPISLQHQDYVASNARTQSLAAGDPVVDPEITNRSYRGKRAVSNSYPDLPMLQNIRQQARDKPVILVVTATNPMVFDGVEQLVDGILVTFGVQVTAVQDIIKGRFEPSGLLPMQMPLDMETVEANFEDTPMDLKTYVDTMGNDYDFGFGLNWSGVINDERTAKYQKNVW